MKRAALVALLAVAASLAAGRAERPYWPAFEDPRCEQHTIVWPDYVAKPLAK